MRGTPAMMRRVIEMFPGLDVIACHFGGYRLLDEAEENIIGLPVYVDTAWPPSLGDVDPSGCGRSSSATAPNACCSARTGHGLARR